MIQLTDTERKVIKFTKGHYEDRYYRGSWHVSFKPLFFEFYGWCPNEHKRDYINGLFNLLFDTYMKIADDQSGTNHQLRSVFNAAFNKSFRRPQRRAIERAIAELCGLIQCNAVLDKNKNKRYEL